MTMLLAMCILKEATTFNFMAIKKMVIYATRIKMLEIYIWQYKEKLQ